MVLMVIFSQTVSALWCLVQKIMKLTIKWTMLYHVQMIKITKTKKQSDILDNFAQVNL